MIEQLVRHLLRHRQLWLLVGLSLTVAAWFPAQRLAFDQSIEAMYSQHNPRLQDYLHSKATFGGDEFVIVAYRDPELLTDAGLDRLSHFATGFHEVPGVVPGSVQDLGGTMRLANQPFLAKQRGAIRELYRGVLLGSDDHTTAIVLRLRPRTDSHAPPRRQVISNIRALADKTVPVPPAFVVGEPVQVDDMFRFVESDGEVLGLWSSLLLLVVILFLFQSMRWVVIPLIVVHVTLVWTKGLLVLANLRLSMVSSMLTSLVTIIGVATVVHVAVRFRRLRHTHPADASINLAMTELLPAIFWTCVTTMAGFLVQLSSHIHPVRSFGLMMGLGSVLVLVVATILLPGMTLFGNPAPSRRGADHSGRTSQWLLGLANWVDRAPRAWSIACVGTMAFSLVGLLFLKVETDFSRNFRENSPIVSGLNFVESEMGGVGNWEVSFHIEDMYDAESLERIRRLSRRLREIEGVTKVISLTDGADAIPRVPFLVPNFRAKVRVMQAISPEFVPSLYNEPTQTMRIMLRARERQPSETKVALIARVEEVTREEFPEAKVSGLFVLLTFLVESLLNDQWVSFVLSAAVIVAMMLIAFRSLWIAVISLIPNLVPITIVLGAMGWLGLPINIGTAMIVSVSMGLTVDSSIHFLAGYERCRAAGMSGRKSLRETQREVGSSLVFANIALVVGFLALTLSHFVPLIYFGALVSLAMVGGLFGNLVLLPLLLRGRARPVRPASL